MVKQCGLLVFLLMYSIHAMAADFTASVNRNSVAVGQAFTLTLKLSGTSASAKPDWSALNQNFRVLNQQQSTQTTIINGKVESSVSWQLSLMAKRKGQSSIPSITIDTVQGLLTSKPITVKVLSASELPDSHKQNDVSISSEVSKKELYQNEPVMFTLSIMSKQPIFNLRLDELKVEDAVIDSMGKAKVVEKIVDGVPVKSIESRYLITPLKFGELNIPEILMQAELAISGDRRSFDSGFNSAFDLLRNFDSMDNWFGLSQRKPITLASQPLTLKVKPPLSSIKPWLPATSVVLSEQWEKPQELVAGEPIVRTLSIFAGGIAATQLPSLAFHQNQLQGLKVYADQPKFENMLEADSISSTREETFTYIPQQAGRLVLPEIKLAWWNTETHRVEFARLAQKTIEVMPAKGASSYGSALQLKSSVIHASDKNVQLRADGKHSVATDPPKLLYVVIGFLVLMVAAMGFLLWRLKHQVSQLKQQPSSVHKSERTTQDYSVKLNAVDSVDSIQGLKQFINQYCEQRWQIPANTSLGRIARNLNELYPKHVFGNSEVLMSTIEKALYAGQSAELDLLKQQTKELFFELNRVKPKHDKAVTLPGLNPN